MRTARPGRITGASTSSHWWQNSTPSRSPFVGFPAELTIRPHGARSERMIFVHDTLPFSCSDCRERPAPRVASRQVFRLLLLGDVFAIPNRIVGLAGAVMQRHGAAGRWQRAVAVGRKLLAKLVCVGGGTYG